MSNFATANTAINEIVKAVDFEFAHDQAINNAALGIQAVMTDGEKDFIIGGKVKPYPSGGMNFIISPIYGHCAGSGIDFIETLTSQQPISVEDADPTYDRIDTIQVRGKAVPYDFQDRKFRDPASGVETVENIPTKKRVVMEVSVKKGADGSVTAPPADTGYIKLAEIVVSAASVSINTEDIKNITARFSYSQNGNWTIDKTRTFNPGYISDIVAELHADHNDDGSHKDAIIKAANILFGNQAGAVRGLIIPTGESMNLQGTDFDALTGMTQVLSAVVSSLNLAFPYANDLLSRYLLLSADPVAASTEDVNITAGGEITVDGIPCTVGQMVFLKDQADPVENGLWEVQSGAWNRYTGFTAVNQNAFTGKFLLVNSGDTNSGKMFYLGGVSYTIGTSPLFFKESCFSPAANPGTVVYRDKNGKTIYDEMIKEASGDLLLDMTRHADEVDGMGRNLFDVFGVSTIPEVMEEIRRRCNNNGEIDASGVPDFRGIEIGDYVDGLDLSGIVAPTNGTAPQAWNDTYKNNRIVVSGFNTYKNVGDTENTKNHILFTFRNVIAKGRINSTDTNTGGYAASEMRIWLEGANGDGSGAFAIGLKAALGGDYLYTIRKAHSTKGGYAWKGYTVFPPTELEVFGYKTYGDESNQYNTNVQFPIFQKGYAYRMKRFNGSRAWWWEMDPTASYSAHFCTVSSYGYAGCSLAGSTDGGVSPAFLVR